MGFHGILGTLMEDFWRIGGASRLSSGHCLSRSGRPLPSGRGQAPGAALSPLGERAGGRQAHEENGIKPGGFARLPGLMP